jgi:hypothetical protein
MITADESYSELDMRDTLLATYPVSRCCLLGGPASLLMPATSYSPARTGCCG